MTFQTLSRLVNSIGGSAKRNDEGKNLGITGEDADLTPGGRRLIGKIGIGLFSVSQLAHSFRIVTKVEGEDYRLTAEINLRAYTEDNTDQGDLDDDDQFVSGDVYIVREAASDIEAHGTDIIIENLKPAVRDLLRSADRWRDLEERQRAAAAGDRDTLATLRVEEPKYHIGWMGTLRPLSEGTSVLTIPASLPWDDADPSDHRMGRLMDAVEREFTRTERPDLETTLDAYLEMLWNLSLSVPVGYVDTHPFDLTSQSGVRLFWLSNESRGQSTEIQLTEDLTVREAVKLTAPGNPELKDGLENLSPFRVQIDGFTLLRPIRFKFFPTSSRGLDRPLLFVGRYSPRLGTIDPMQRGGGLSFEGYLFWNGRVVPKENNGVLIRIRGASGALFDNTFFNYKVSEITRLRQISSELFIKLGVDAALNIDRESYNFSHPHIVLLSGWLHRALRQVTNRHKELSQRSLDVRRAETTAAASTALSAYAHNVWRERQGSEPTPDVTVVSNEQEAVEARRSGGIALARSGIPSLSETLATPVREERDRKAQALAEVLAAYGILEGKDFSEQQRLIEAILYIFFSEGQA
jgi:hypothetical protein